MNCIREEDVHTASYTSEFWTDCTLVLVTPKASLPKAFETARLPEQLFLNSCCSVIKSVSGCTSENRKSLRHSRKIAERISDSQLPSLEEMYRTCCTRKTIAIIRDSTHPDHKWYRMTYSHTKRLNSSFWHWGVEPMNTSSFTWTYRPQLPFCILPF